MGRGTRARGGFLPGERSGNETEGQRPEAHSLDRRAMCHYGWETPDVRGKMITQRERIRTMRMQRHLGAATLACLAYTVSRPGLDTIAGFLILTALVGFVLGSLCRAMDARLGHWWGWLYGEPEGSTRLDVWVEGIVHHLTAVWLSHSVTTDPGIDTPDNELKVRILPLDREGR